jgi:Overcoming lysogenization defect protein-like, TOPRIM domain
MYVGHEAVLAAVTQRATLCAMTSMAPVVIAVEGVSDRVVLELLARRRGRDLAAEGIEIVPIGGAHAISRFVSELPPRTAVRGLCDANEAYLLRRVLQDVSVCVPDLEGELIRALGVEAVQTVVAEAGDLRTFRKFQQQPAQRGRALDAQLDRWLRSISSRYNRYLPLLVQALDLDHVPRPLDEVLGTARGAV